jgi:hypothetical protein
MPRDLILPTLLSRSTTRGINSAPERLRSELHSAAGCKPRHTRTQVTTWWGRSNKAPCCSSYGTCLLSEGAGVLLQLQATLAIVRGLEAARRYGPLASQANSRCLLAKALACGWNHHTFWGSSVLWLAMLQLDADRVASCDSFSIRLHAVLPLGRVQ